MARAISIAGVIVLVATGLGAAAVLTPSQEERWATSCDSCSLRHNRLKTLGNETP